MTDLDFDLDNFDLETMDLNNSKPSTSSMKSKSISDLFNKSSSSENNNLNVKQLHVDNMRNVKSDSSIDMDDLGIDMLVNKNKFKKNDVSNDYTPSQKPTPPPTTSNDSKSSSSFFNLFGSKKQPSQSNDTSNNDIEDITDIDKALENLDKDLNKGMDKIKKMSGPGIPNFNSSNSSNTYNNSSSSNNNYQHNMSGNGNGDDNYIPGESVNMSYEDIQKAKFDLLCKFERLRSKKNVKLPKVFSMSSDYEEMKYEYERLLHQIKMDNSVKMQRRFLITFVNGVQFLNNRIDPFDINLDGWSESVHDGIDEYDEVFEELYEKYQGSGAMSPEMRLCFMVAGSAFMFHLQNSMLKSSIPNADVVFKNDPNLAQQFMKRAREMSGTEMFDGLMKNQSGGGGNGGPPLYNDSVGNGSGGDIPDLDTLMRNL